MLEDTLNMREWRNGRRTGFRFRRATVRVRVSPRVLSCNVAAVVDLYSVTSMPAVKYTQEMVAAAVRNSRTLTGVLRELGAQNTSGGMVYYIKSRIEKYGLDTSHFVGNAWATGLKRPGTGFGTTRKKIAEDYLVRLPDGKRTGTALLRQALIDIGVAHECSTCGQGASWRGTALVLEVDHVDGNPSNNCIENLRFLCPNCHSQTSTFRSRNRHVVPVGSGRLISPPAQFNSERADPITKVNWPVPERLAALVAEMPLTRIAEQLGVSSVALKKRCVKLGIPTRPRGGWGRGTKDRSFTQSLD